MGIHLVCIFRVSIRKMFPVRYLALIRHAAVEIEPNIPAREWQLSANGRTLTRQLAPQLIPYRLNRIVTSTEPKAVETGQILADELGLSWQTAVNLHEHDRQGTPYFARHEDFVTAVSRFFTQPDKLVLGQETAVQARDRFVTAVTRLLTAYPQENLAIVAHGTVITLYLCHTNPDIDPMAFWQKLTLPAAFILSLPQKTLKHSLKTEH